MRRRQFLAATSLTAVSVGGCLGSLPDEADSTPADALEGHFQFGYDAGNTNHAVGLSGPTEEPSVHQAYTEVGHAPLATEEGLHFATTSYRVDGERRWDSLEFSSGSANRPAIYDESLVAAGYDGETFHVLNLATGDERWQLELSDQRAKETRVVDGQAFFATVHGAGCVDLDAQEEQWYTNLSEEPPRGRPAGWHTPAITAEHVVMVNRQRPREGDAPLVYGLSRSTGTIEWTIELEGGAWGHNQPIADDRFAYLTPMVDDPPDHEDGSRAQITAIDPGAGEVVWRKSVAGQNEAQPAVADTDLYFAYGDLETDQPRVLSAFDTDNGTIQWTTEIPMNEVRIVVTGDTIFLGDTLHCLALDRANGDQRWKLQIPDAAAAAGYEAGADRPSPFRPVVADDRLFTHIGNETVVGLW